MKKFQWIFYICGWCLLLSGCVNDVLDQTSAGDTGEVKLVYSVSQMDGAQTRASDSEIRQVILLFFDATGNGSGAYVGMLESSAVNWLSNGVEFLTPKGKGTEPKLADEKSYNVWAIANCDANGLKKDTILKLVTPGITERELKPMLFVGNSADIAWPLLLSGTGVMSGRDKTVTVELKRNVAKVDVYNDYTSLTMTSLRLVNMRRYSYVMDMHGAFPAEFSSVPTKQSVTLVDGTFLRLYTFENYAEGAPEKELSVVVGGKLTGSNEVLYYRSTMARQPIGNGQYVQKIDRNTSYVLRIVSITGEGSKTWQEAVSKNPNVVLSTTLPAWGEPDSFCKYADNGFGFALSLTSYVKDLATISSETFNVDLYWSDMGKMMKDPPVDEGSFDARLDGRGVAEITSFDRKKIACRIVGYGVDTLRVTYRNVTWNVSVEVREP